MALVGEVAKPRPQRRVVRPPRSVADRCPIRADEGRGPPLAHLEQRPKMSDGLALGGGRSWLRLRVRSTMESRRRAYHFFREALSAPPRRALHPPAAASAWRSRPRAPSDASQPTRRDRRTRPSNCTASPPTSVPPAKIGALRTGLLLPQHADDLLFRKTHSLHSQTLQRRSDSKSRWMNFPGARVGSRARGGAP